MQVTGALSPEPSHLSGCALAGNCSEKPVPELEPWHSYTRPLGQMAAPITLLVYAQDKGLLSTLDVIDCNLSENILFHIISLHVFLTFVTWLPHMHQGYS